MTRPVEEWMRRADELEREAQSARASADSEPSISVAELVTWRDRLIMHGGKTYSVKVTELAIEKVI